MRQEIRAALNLCRSLIQESREIRTITAGHSLSYECKSGSFSIVASRNGIADEKGRKFKHEWSVGVINTNMSQSISASSTKNKHEKELAVGVFNLLENRKMEIDLEVENERAAISLYKIADFVYEVDKQNGNTKKPGLISVIANKFQIQR